MTETKQMKVQRKFFAIVQAQNLPPDEAISAFILAALRIMGTVYKHPDGSPLSLEDAKQMMVDGLKASNSSNGEVKAPELTIVDTAETVADHLNQIVRDEANLEGAKPISTEEALRRIQEDSMPPGAELQE
jgi:hypothetical protein